MHKTTTVTPISCLLIYLIFPPQSSLPPFLPNSNPQSAISVPPTANAKSAYSFLYPKKKRKLGEKQVEDVADQFDR